MSYEGYEEILCKNGHYHTYDCYDAPDRGSWRCPDCGEVLATWNGVDETNGHREEFTLNLIEVTPAVLCQCCGGKGVLEPPTFKVVPR